MQCTNVNVKMLISQTYVLNSVFRKTIIALLKSWMQVYVGINHVVCYDNLSVKWQDSNQQLTVVWAMGRNNTKKMICSNSNKAEFLACASLRSPQWNISQWQLVSFCSSQQGTGHLVCQGQFWTEQLGCLLEGKCFCGLVHIEFKEQVWHNVLSYYSCIL